MTREDNNSLVEMLAKIPVTETKGSLLSAIGKLLRVIDISENSIMIPTLLKDKCEFDANEMLTLAKILKASILGHNDLVEFYLSESSSQNNSPTNNSINNNNNNNTQLAHHHQQLHLNTNNTIINNYHTHQHSGNTISNTVMISNGLISNGINGNNNMNMNTSSSSGSSGNGHVHKHQLNHLNPIHQLSATPSLKSSGSEQSTSSSPCTPIPQTESIGSSSGQLQLWKQQQRGVNSDPDATVRLLLQIEQLKIFIPQVTGIFESIIELYKNSVDTITYGGGGGGHGGGGSLLNK